MSNDLYYGKLSEASANDNSTIAITLPDGSFFPVVIAYSESKSHLVVALVVVSCISLVAVVGLLAVIAISAFNTRYVKNPNMFVRTHVASYFVSLLVCDLLQAIGSIMNSAWVRQHAVTFGGLCTAQGAIKHIADVGIALWSLIIAVRTFWVLFLRIPIKHHLMWVTLVGSWSLIGAIIIAGPATINVNKSGPFYGISGDWCWISSEYQVHRVVLDYMVMFLSALFSFILYTLVFIRQRGIVRGQGSTSVETLVDQAKEKYEHRLARQMLLYPIAYTILILPIACSRFSAWAGHDVPFAATIFSDFIYLLAGVVHVVLFASTRRILPPRSIIPKFLISKPELLVASTAFQDGEFDSYYAGAPGAGARDVEKAGRGFGYSARVPSVATTEPLDKEDPFADPLPPTDEALVRRTHSPDSEHSSRDITPSATPGRLTPMPTDYVDIAIDEANHSPPADYLEAGHARAASSASSIAPSHRNGEELEVPYSPSGESVLKYYGSS
ncbi:hypothetical protein BC834DRAFT_641977 [Gloeopeniophorella convolvens]|nr:hypothetical protein BC834DRAFT_641977 [Gloeopeniophorella convolvens]